MEKNKEAVFKDEAAAAGKAEEKRPLTDEELVTGGGSISQGSENALLTFNGKFLNNSAKMSPTS